MAADDISWNLSELFKSPTDPAINGEIERTRALTVAFRKKYHGKIKSLSAKGLLGCIKEYEQIREVLSDIYLYSRLSFRANMNLPETQALNENVNKLNSEVDGSLSFFTIEIGSLLGSNPAIVSDPATAEYSHYLSLIVKGVPTSSPRRKSS